MPNNKLLQLDFAKMGQQVVRRQTGVCGIKPMLPPAPTPPPPTPKKLPESLIRPPCLPGSELGRFPPTCDAQRAYYCPPSKDKYGYPPFSENIKFVPGERGCWWLKPKLCEFKRSDEDIVLRI